MYEPYAKKGRGRLRRSRESEDGAERATARSCLTMEDPAGSSSLRPEANVAAWTEPEHQSYLRHMEEDFVAKMFSMQYCYKDICGQCPTATPHVCPRLTGRAHTQLQGGSCGAPPGFPLLHSAAAPGIQNTLSLSSDVAGVVGDGATWQDGDYPPWLTQQEMPRNVMRGMTSSPCPGCPSAATPMEEGEGKSEGDSEEKEKNGPGGESAYGREGCQSEDERACASGEQQPDPIAGEDSLVGSASLLHQDPQPTPEGVPRHDTHDDCAGTAQVQSHPGQLYTSPWLRRYLPYDHRQDYSQPMSICQVSTTQLTVRNNSEAAAASAAPRQAVHRSALCGSLSLVAKRDSGAVMAQLLSVEPESSEMALPQDLEAEREVQRSAERAAPLQDNNAAEGLCCPGAGCAAQGAEVDPGSDDAPQCSQPVRARTWLNMARGRGRRAGVDAGASAHVLPPAEGEVSPCMGAKRRARASEAPNPGSFARVTRPMVPVHQQERQQGVVVADWTGDSWGALNCSMRRCRRGAMGPRAEHSAAAESFKWQGKGRGCEVEGDMSEGSCDEGAPLGKEASEGEGEEVELDVGYNPAKVVPVASRPGWHTTKRRKTVKEELMELETQLEERWDGSIQEASGVVARDAEEGCTSSRRRMIPCGSPEHGRRAGPPSQQGQTGEGRGGQEGGTLGWQQGKGEQGASATASPADGRQDEVQQGTRQAEHHHHYHFHINFFGAQQRQGEPAGQPKGKGAEGYNDAGERGHGERTNKGTWVTSGLGAYPQEEVLMSARMNAGQGVRSTQWLADTPRGQALADAAQAAAAAAVDSLHGRGVQVNGEQRRQQGSERARRSQRHQPRAREGSSGAKDQTVPTG